MIQILIADDQNLIRKGLRALLATDEEFVVVGEAENGQEVIELAEKLQPDVILMDLQMPKISGIESTRKIRQRFPEIQVLVLTVFADQEYVSQALLVGACGYLLKNTPYEELSQAIQLAHKGYTQIGPGLLQAMLATLPTDLSRISGDLSSLTQREREIVYWLTQGANNSEIAQALYISEKTVRNSISRILSHFNLRDRTQLAILALQTRANSN